MRRSRAAWAVTVALACAAIVGACGEEDTGQGVLLKLYAGLDPGGTNVKYAKLCGDRSDGRYRIEIVPLANSADASRELLVRRLAAEDSDIAFIEMDVIWTAEFAAAGWLRELTGADKEDAVDDVLPGPLASVMWDDKVYAVPMTTNAQLLWYRKDLVPEPPKTWEEMIEMAKALPAGEGNILEQGQRYEGYVVWFNSLVSSAGGSIVDEEGQPALDDSAVKAAQIISDVAKSGRASPTLSTDQEDQARFAFEEGKGAFMLNWPFVYATTRAAAEASDVAKNVFDNLGWARWPGVEGGGPSRVSLGGGNYGISNFGPDPELATEAALCMTQRSQQDEAAVNEGEPPVMNASYDDATVRESYPFADLLREQLTDSVPRPVTPSYADVTLAIQQSLHPPLELNPEPAIGTLRDRLETLADGGLY
jgi:multiple sugar transport system substrate-binding protein